MRPGLIIEGIGCVKCAEAIEEKFMAKSTVEKIFSGIHKKMIFVHISKNVTRKSFLSSLMDVPLLLKGIIEAAHCHCCREIHFDFPAG
ncbi:hypothetical protein [Jeotgalibaca porci]|nr:hypothetical protein [Jeotgalibaca porci]